MDISVTIITLNEERCLEGCLKSLPEDSEIIVVDSGSTDDTVNIAKKFGAQVHNRVFTNYAEQKNFALSLCSKPWILSLDADEKLEPTLKKSIIEICGNKELLRTNIVGFKIKRDLCFLGRRMKFGGTVSYPLRLIRNKKGSFVNEIHEEIKIEPGARLGPLPQGEILHYSYDNLNDYFERFNSYTSKIARKNFLQGRPSPGLVHILRPWYEFVLRYFIKLGFLDGYPGYCYALLSSFYTYVKYAKLRELYFNKQ